MNRMLRPIVLFAIATGLISSATAQDKLPDGTSLTWDHELAVGLDSLKNDSVMVQAYSIRVYEARANQLGELLEKALPAAKFKKSGYLMKAENVLFPAGSGTPVNLVASTDEDKKTGVATLRMAILNSSGLIPHTTELEAGMHDLSIRMNKALVQEQIDEQKKKLEKVTGKTESAVKAQDKTQGKLNKAQKKMEKISKEKVDLQNEHNILEKDIALQNERWTTSQDPKDLKKLTKAREKITKNESKLASALKDESKTQADISKYTEAVPDAAKEREAKATDQADVQRTVDALQRKLEAVK
ncbi:MAG: hypothetical protein IPL86_01500 [Flavobacteriales bacterium]|nr:hypothetical protein [Flavobacteriales bacterium]